MECIAYCFHDVTGYSKFGSYTGDGNNDRAITTGFKPDFVLIKSTVGSDNWRLYDTRRGITAGGYLEPNRTDADDTSNAPNLTMTSTGFTITSGGATAGNNANGNLYIYWAMAKNVPSNTTLVDSFKAVTWTGNDNNNRAITGLGFRPDFVWIKRRSSSEDHALYDGVRGGNKQLSSNTTAAEVSNSSTYNGLPSFGSDGFSVGNNGGTNRAPETYVGWAWKAGNTWQHNIDGTIPSTTNTNTANGFSVVKYTGTGSATTIGHNLGVVPTFIIGKTLESAAKWRVYHSSIGATKALNLDTDEAVGTSANYWNDTTPTSSVFSVGSDLSPNGEDVIAYCWTEKSGFSKFGTYTGNGSANNAITGLGFKPDWLMIKNSTDAGNDWQIYDSARTEGYVLLANSSNAVADNSSNFGQFDSDGFTVQSNNDGNNKSGSTYLYMAFKMTPKPATGYMAFLVIAGGGGGCDNSIGGGGGAGGLRTSYGSESGGGSSLESNIVLSAKTYTITVGAGGAYITNGSDSVLDTITSIGGGHGRDTAIVGSNGGSGGGSGYNTSSTSSGTANQGFGGAGGNLSSSPAIGGGGGGAAEAGNTDAAGHGGDGLAINITGSLVTYAGGGGGSRNDSTVSPGGDGGGGSGATQGIPSSGTAATVNTGGGGGAGGGGTPTTGGAGGSGVVILRLKTAEYSGSVTGSPTITTDGDYTILKYTGSGTYVHS